MSALYHAPGNRLDLAEGEASATLADTFTVPVGALFPQNQYWRRLYPVQIALYKKSMEQSFKQLDSKSVKETEAR